MVYFVCRDTSSVCCEIKSGVYFVCRDTSSVCCEMKSGGLLCV